MTECSEKDCLRELPGRYWNSRREIQRTDLVAPELRARNKRKNSATYIKNKPRVGCSNLTSFLTKGYHKLESCDASI